MALDFPSSPINGQVYSRWTYNSTTQTWNLTPSTLPLNIAYTDFSNIFTSAQTINNTLTVNTIVKSGGTSSQFLKADGSIDSSTYLITTGSGTGLSGVALLASSNTFTGQLQSTLANNTITGGGQIYLNGTTGNRIDFNTNGTGAPTFTTRSVGAKIVLYPNISATGADYALGVEAGSLWQGVPDTTNSFKWYGGTTQLASLTGAGVFTASSIVKSGGTSSQYLMADGSVSTSGGSLSALTIGTGLSGTSYNGSSAVTIANTGVLSINGSAGAITNVAKTDISNSFTIGEQVISTGADTNKGLVVKANSTSQKADLQQWQNSSGEPNSKINAAGQLVLVGTDMYYGSYAQPLIAANYVSATEATFTHNFTMVPFTKIGQTVTITGVSGGTYNGIWVITAVSTSSFNVVGTGFTNIAGTGGTAKISPRLTAVSDSQNSVAIVAVSYSSGQNANIQEWHKFNNVAVASVDSSGTFTAESYKISSLYNGVVTNGIYSAATNYLNFATNSLSRMSITPAGQVNINSSSLVLGSGSVAQQFGIVSSSATNIVSVIRGAISQSGDLTQWQSNTGTIAAKIDFAGNLTATSVAKSGGTSSQILMADGSTTNLNNSSTLDIIPLDDITNEINGQNSRFLPKYQGQKVTINNPLRLLVTINGIIQTVGFTDNTWQSFLPKDGFVVDYDGYIAFSEVPPIGSSFQGRLMAGSDTTSRTTTYPFRASDILLGE